MWELGVNRNSELLRQTRNLDLGGGRGVSNLLLFNVDD